MKKLTEVMMNLYFNKPPMFNVSSDDDTDTRTGDIFDNYYGIEHD